MKNKENKKKNKHNNQKQKYEEQSEENVMKKGEQRTMRRKYNDNMMNT